MNTARALDNIKALVKRIEISDDVFETGRWTFTMPLKKWHALLRSRAYQHGRAIAMRQAWCDQQSPKAWPR